MWCNDLERSYGQLPGGHLPVVYMCILLYVKLMRCNGVAYINGQLEEGVGSICHWYMCIVLYMKLL